MTTCEYCYVWAAVSISQYCTGIPYVYGKILQLGSTTKRDLLLLSPCAVVKPGREDRESTYDLANQYLPDPRRGQHKNPRPNRPEGMDPFAGYRAPGPSRWWSIRKNKQGH